MASWIIRPPEIDEGVEGGADGAAREQDVVDQHHRLVLDRERDIGAAHDRRSAQVEIVAIERDVEGSYGKGGAVDGGHLDGQPPGQGHAARAKANESNVLGTAVLLDDLVGDPRERAIEGSGVENLRFDHLSPYEPRWAHLKESTEPGSIYTGGSLAVNWSVAGTPCVPSTSRRLPPALDDTALVLDGDTTALHDQRPGRARGDDVLHPLAVPGDEIGATAAVQAVVGQSQDRRRMDGDRGPAAT